LKLWHGIVGRTGDDAISVDDDDVNAAAAAADHDNDDKSENDETKEWRRLILRCKYDYCILFFTYLVFLILI